MQFIPNQPKVARRSVPYFEDSPHNIPGYRTRKSIPTLQSEVISILHDLGGMAAHFLEGTYKGDAGQVRYGYSIQFSQYGNPARLDCAALPIKTETETKKTQAIAQALFLLRDELKAIYFSNVHKPNGFPLIEYLVGPNGRTLSEELVASGTIPMLGAGNEER